MPHIYVEVFQTARDYSLCAGMDFGNVRGMTLRPLNGSTRDEEPLVDAGIDRGRQFILVPGDIERTGIHAVL